MRLVIIGASFAGLACAKEASRLYPEAEIIIVERETVPLHLPNAAYQLLKGEISELSQAKVDLWEEVAQSSVAVWLGCELLAVQVETKSVTVSGPERVEELAYDYLVLAMGASQAANLAVGDLGAGLLTFKTHRASQESLEALSAAQSVVVVGAGQLGLEGLDALRHLPLDLRLIEAQEGPLAKHLDGEMAEQVSRALRQAGITCHFKESVEAVRPAASAQQVEIVTQKGTYQADAVLLATNFLPNTLPLDDQFTTYPDGSLVVDDYLRTNQDGVFAVGDLIAQPQAYFGWAYAPMISQALLTGRLAAQNLLKPRFPLGQGQRWVESKLFGRQLFSLGLTEREAKLWEKPVALSAQTPMSHIKLLVAQTSGRLLGAQLLSENDLSALANLLGQAIRSQWTVADLLTDKSLYQWPQTAEQKLLLTMLTSYGEVLHAD